MSKFVNRCRRQHQYLPDIWKIVGSLLLAKAPLIKAVEQLRAEAEAGDVAARALADVEILPGCEELFRLLGLGPLGKPVLLRNETIDERARQFLDKGRGKEIIGVGLDAWFEHVRVEGLRFASKEEAGAAFRASPEYADIVDQIAAEFKAELEAEANPSSSATPLALGRG